MYTCTCRCVGVAMDNVDWEGLGREGRGYGSFCTRAKVHAYLTLGSPSGTLTPWRMCYFFCSSSTLQPCPRVSEAVSYRAYNT